MLNKQKFLGGLLLGAAAGVAASIFFNSNKGKEFVAEAKAKYSNLNTAVDKLLARGKVFLDEMEAKISEA